MDAVDLCLGGPELAALRQMCLYKFVRERRWASLSLSLSRCTLEDLTEAAGQRFGA